MDKHVEVMINKEGLAAAPLTPQMFGNAGKEHMKKYGEINYNNYMYIRVRWKIIMTIKIACLFQQAVIQFYYPTQVM